MTEKNLLSLASLVRRSDEILTSEIDGEVVMMSVNRGIYSGLNAIGTEIWHLLESPRRVSELCDLLLARYEVDRGQCEKEVLSFLNDLASDEIIKISDAPE